MISFRVFRCSKMNGSIIDDFFLNREINTVIDISSLLLIVSLFYSRKMIVPPFDSRPESWRKEVNSTALNGFVSNSTSREILLSFGCLWIVNLFNEFASLAANERKRSRHYFNNFSYLSREISDSSGIILIRWNGIFRRLIILPYSI